MSTIEYLILNLAVVIAVIQFMNWIDQEPENLFVQVGKTRAFKSSYEKVRDLQSYEWAGYERRINLRLTWQQEPQELVVKELTDQFFQRTGKTVFFVGKFTDEEMVYELLGLKVFEAEIAALSVDHIIAGHGSGDGRYPQYWIVGGKSATNWLKQLGIEEALVCACEWPKAVRYCGTFDGRIIRL